MLRSEMDISNLKLSDHALKQYCLRVHSNVYYYITHLEVFIEINNSLSNVNFSNHIPQEFFSGVSFKRMSDVTLYENTDLIFAVRGKIIFTIMNKPGKDKISDMLYKKKRLEEF